MLKVPMQSIKQLNNKGFGLLGILIVIIVLAAVSGAGVYIYHKQHKTKTTAAVTSSKAPSTTKSGGTSAPPASPVQNPYAGWKSATLKYEQITYRYPANWTITDSSASSPKGTGCVYPGTDNIVLTSPSNHQITLRTGVWCLGGSGAKTFSSVPITSLGKGLYIALAATVTGDGSTPANPTSACLSPTATQSGYPVGLKSKNIFVNGSVKMPDDEFCYWPYLFNNSNATPPQLTAQQMEGSADFTTAKLVFESMKYAAN